MNTYWEDAIGQGVLLNKPVVYLFERAESASDDSKSRAEDS